MIKFYCHAFTKILFTVVARPWHSMENTDGSLATRLKMPSDIRAKLCQASDYLCCFNCISYDIVSHDKLSWKISCSLTLSKMLKHTKTFFVNFWASNNIESMLVWPTSVFPTPWDYSALKLIVDTEELVLVICLNT